MGNNFAGTNGGNASKADVENLGLYYMAALDIFHAIQKPGYERLSIRVSLFEIYGGKLYDLLNNRASVKCLENSKGNVCFPGLSERNVGNAEELMEKITEGATLRSIGTTSRNADSSRSHAVLQLHLYESIQKQFTALERRKRGTGTSVEPAQKNDSEWSRLTFIDLAGSERGADTSQASRATRLEGAEINTSLLALKEVIRALATGDSLSHVPFRGSKLTQVLKQSFVGKNCRSVMIACISPSMSNCEQTLNTLRYADRVKERNPETGELNPGAAVKNVTPKGKRTNTVRSETSMGTTLSTATTNFSTNQSYSSVSSDILDELLASPSGASDDELVTNESGAVAASKLRSAINVLLATHQDARTFMLEMVKEEMTLVSNADAQVDNFDDYLAMVDTLHEEQLSMITILREQLLQYRLISQSSNTRILPNDIRTTEHSDAEDSFEDLRV